MKRIIAGFLIGLSMLVLPLAAPASAKPATYNYWAPTRDFYYQAYFGGRPYVCSYIYAYCNPGVLPGYRYSPTFIF